VIAPRSREDVFGVLPLSFVVQSYDNVAIEAMGWDPRVLRIIYEMVLRIQREELTPFPDFSVNGIERAALRVREINPRAYDAFQASLECRPLIGVVLNLQWSRNYIPPGMVAIANARDYYHSLSFFRAITGATSLGA
jgi:hypothetical protein